MRHVIITIAAVLMSILPTKAQRLGNISVEAQYITDKMIVELGLDNSIRGSIMQLNLNYLSGINSYRDIDSRIWRLRNREMKRLMNAAQWRRYCDTYYFYRPIGWSDDAYVHNIYKPHPHKYGKHKHFDKRHEGGKHHGKPRRDMHKRDGGRHPFGGRR